MSDDPDAPEPRFRRYLAAFAFTSMLAFVFLNYRDPWPPIVPPPLAPPPDAPRASPANTLSLAPPRAVEIDPATPSERAAEADDAAQPTSLPLRLLATVVQDDPSRSLARIDDAELSDAQMLLSGQVFEGRPHVRLVTIESDSVLLDNYGTLERLPLEPGGLQFTADSSQHESEEPAAP